MLNGSHRRRRAWGAHAERREGQCDGVNEGRQAGLGGGRIDRRALLHPDPHALKLMPLPDIEHGIPGLHAFARASIADRSDESHMEIQGNLMCRPRDERTVRGVHVLCAGTPGACKRGMQQTLQSPAR